MPPACAPRGRKHPTPDEQVQQHSVLDEVQRPKGELFWGIQESRVRGLAPVISKFAGNGGIAGFDT